MLWFVTPTAGLTDGQTIGINGVVAITGTRQYQAVVGTNTIPVIERVAVNPDDCLQKSEIRSWTANSGKTVKAHFLTVSGGKARLLSESGKQLAINVWDLIDADQEFIREYQKERRRLEQKAMDGN